MLALVMAQRIGEIGGMGSIDNVQIIVWTSGWLPTG